MSNRKSKGCLPPKGGVEQRGPCSLVRSSKGNHSESYVCRGPARIQLLLPSELWDRPSHHSPL